MLFRNDYSQDNMTSGETCPVQLDLLWVTDVGASIHSTPVIYPLFRDGVKTVYLNKNNILDYCTNCSKIYRNS